MSRLKSRQKFIPNGFVFYQPETKWHSTRMTSFENVVQGLIAHRKANPFLTQKHGWSTDYDEVCEEVDAYNARICERMGWTDFIMASASSPPPPKFKPLSLLDQKQLGAVAGRVKKIWSGVRTINEWIDSNTDPVDPPLAEARAATCVACPLNGSGDFTKWFTQPASEAIKRQLEKVSNKKLVTSVDDKLGVCEACLCPMKLKVWTPLDYIKPHVSDDVLKELAKGKDCWVLKELSA